MSQIDEQLIELVRLLEQKGHIFVADPKVITEQLQNEQGSPSQKLFFRAKRIDADGNLTQILTRIDNRMKLLVFGLSLLWFMVGFFGLLTIMQAKTINFFYLLLCILGFHGLMLIFWLAWLLVGSKSHHHGWLSFFQPNTWTYSKDLISQTVMMLYQQQQKIGFKWYISRISHQLWLASLLGMFIALLMMFLVKNYQFIWESTLLDHQTVVKIVEILAWLPNMLGFTTPTADDIMISQFLPEHYSNQIAFRWAMLLIGSLLLYGILPRLLAWLISWLMLRHQRFHLDLQQPYYQKILASWQKQVIDTADDFYDNKPLAPLAKMGEHKTLVVLLEYPFADETWYQKTLKQTPFDYFGVLADREDMVKLTDYLSQQNIQVLLGITTRSLPDRGVMRQLDKIAQLAKNGLIVQLLDGFDEQRLKQWQTALAERQIAIVDYLTQGVK